MSHPTDCPICAAIDPSLSNVQNGNRLDVSEATIRRHRAANQEIDSFFGIPNEIITSRGKTVRLVDGSYEKVTYSPAKAALLETLKYDDIEKAIGSFNFSRVVSKIDTKPQTFILCLADFQVGKAREAGGGTPELIERVMTSLHNGVERAKEEHPQEIVLLDLGDGIEGFSNTGSQAQTNDIDLTTQIRTFRRLMIEAIKLFAPLTPRLTYITVPSNHCQLRAPGGKDLASVPENDFGIEVSYQLEDVLKDRPEYSHVRFVRPAPYAEALTHRTVDGTILGAVHGHQAKSPEKIAEWWKGQSHGRRDGLESADILLHGHYHSARMQQSGDARWVFGAPTSDNGSQWFTNKTGETSQSGMLALNVSNGSWNNVEIL